MKENLIRLKTIIEERERVYNKAIQDYEHYKRNPPGTPDGNVVALKGNVAALFAATSDLVTGYREYMAALEQ
jgi:hypothetical protein